MKTIKNKKFNGITKIKYGRNKIRKPDPKKYIWRRGNRIPPGH